jgi:hypothetical protein
MNNIDELIIPRSRIESIANQEITPLMVGFSWRAKVWGQPQKLIQVIAMQTIALGIIFMLGILPVDRGINSWNAPASERNRTTTLIGVNGMLSLAVLGGINWWMFTQGKRRKRLLKLVEQIEEYNQIVNSLSVLAKVDYLTDVASQLDREAQQSGDLLHRDRIYEILSQTRHNLLTALEIDRYLHQHPQSPEFTSMARDLINLQHLAHEPELAEDLTLLAQAWEIGMSVYQESQNWSRLT